MYRFKLEALLNHRRHQEEACQKELALSQRKLGNEKEKLNRKKKEKREQVQKLQMKQKENIAVNDIILRLNYIQQLSQDILIQSICVQESIDEVNQKREALITIMKKRKSLEKLKEKQWQAHQQKQVQQELKLMDEFASIQRARKI